MNADTKYFLLKSNPVPWYRTCGYSNYFPDEKHVQRRCEDFVLIFMLKNTLYFSEDGHERKLTPGECYFQLPGLWQDAKLPSPGAQYFYIHFQAHAVSVSPACEDPSGCAGQVINGEGIPFSVRGTFDAKRYLPEFEKLYKSAAQPWEQLRCQSLLTQILDMVSHELLSEQTEEQVLSHRILNYVTDTYTQDLNPADFERELHYTYDYLRRLFKRDYGMTPLQYVNHLRNEAAGELLRSTRKNLNDIALMVGYPSEATFFKAFKRETGLSPRAWRDHILEKR